MEVEGGFRERHVATAQCREKGAHLAGRPHADRVPERDLVAAEIEQLPAQVRHHSGGSGAVPRIGDDHREISADAKARVLRLLDHGSVARDGFVARSVQILS